MSEFFFNLIAVSGKIGEGVHIVCSNVLVGGASSPSLTGFRACSTNSEFFLMGIYPVSNRLSGLFHKELFFLGWIDINNITFFQKGGKCGMM